MVCILTNQIEFVHEKVREHEPGRWKYEFNKKEFDFKLLRLNAILVSS